MKLCPNCHRLSKDDDFCSNCGSAVYDDNTDYSVNCSQIKGHTHEKQTFSDNTASPQQYRSYSNTGSSSSPEKKKKGSGCLNLIILIIVINVLADVFFGGISELFEFLGNLLNEI
ncbi:MAG: hypothetical protein ACI4J0_04025 [Huintestinicola sp.]|uniref:hypothetical protein n=1 Tax=Huintestinicola sp. TaxID=2981661 RepID=UPI003EFBE813